MLSLLGGRECAEPHLLTSVAGHGAKVGVVLGVEVVVVDVRELVRQDLDHPLILGGDGRVELSWRVV